MSIDSMDEIEYFTDDARLIAELLKEQWSLGPGEEPNISYVPESFMIQARIGAIYVYPMSMPMNISTVDYRTIQKLGYVSIRLSTRDRDRHFAWGQEVMRILLVNRRAPVLRRCGYTFMEVTSSRMTPDLSGWYTTTFDIKLTCYNRGIRSNGFGPDAEQCELPDGIGTHGVNDPGDCGDDGWAGGQAPNTQTDPGECDEDVWTEGHAQNEPDDPCP